MGHDAQVVPFLLGRRDDRHRSRPPDGLAIDSQLGTGEPAHEISDALGRAHRSRQCDALELACQQAESLYGRDQMSPPLATGYRVNLIQNDTLHGPENGSAALRGQ